MCVLEQVRVLDISSGIAGPFCARLLAGAGADVVKIEDPRGGDLSRREDAINPTHQLENTSALYTYLNQNKRGISLNLETATGQEIFRRLVKVSDVIVESSVPGTLERWHLSYDEVTTVNPGIVLVSITDFGQTGPYRNYKATHLTLAALGGFMNLVGDPGREPLMANFLYCTIRQAFGERSGPSHPLTNEEKMARGNI